MQFILTAGWDDGTADLTERLVRELASGKKVLWLISGGSNIPATVQIMNTIPQKLRPKLTILLADERFGPEGHTDSNWQQLIESGLKPDGAKIYQVLKDGKSLELTVSDYNIAYETAVALNDLVIAQLGVGTDGHIAGLLLNSSALTATQSIASFISDEKPPLSRLTITFAGFKQIDAAYCFAFGQPKAETLKKLQKRNIAIETQPAQILKQIPEAYLYNDQVGHHG